LGAKHVVVNETYEDGVLVGNPVILDDDGKVVAALAAAELRAERRDTEKAAPKAGLLASGDLKQGLRNGVWTSWFDKDHRAAEVRYEAGQPKGPFKVWWPNGTLAVSGHYRGGKPTDLRTEDTPVLPVRKLTVLPEPLFEIDWLCEQIFALSETGMLVVLSSTGERLWSRAVGSDAIVDRIYDVPLSDCAVRILTGDNVLTIVDGKSGSELKRLKIEKRFLKVHPSLGKVEVHGKHAVTTLEVKAGARWVLPDVLSCGEDLRTAGEYSTRILGCRGKEAVYVGNGDLPEISSRRTFESNLRWTRDLSQLGGIVNLFVDQNIVYVHLAQSSEAVEGRPTWAQCGLDLFSGARHFCVTDIVGFPAATNGILYYTTDDQVVALDGLTGNVVWRNTDVLSQASGMFQHPDLLGSMAATPKLIWVAFGESAGRILELQALDSQTGSPRYRERFTFATKLRPHGQVDPWVMAQEGDYLAVLANEGIFVYRKEQPMLLWRSPVRSPLDIRIRKSRIIVLEQDQIRAFGLRDGRTLWQRSLPYAGQSGYFGMALDEQHDLVQFEADFSVRVLPGVRLSTGRPVRSIDLPEPEEGEAPEEDLSGAYRTSKRGEVRDGLTAVVDRDNGEISAVDLRAEAEAGTPLPELPPRWMPSGIDAGR
jgi:outer membrane protein assembly factor BamB